MNKINDTNNGLVKITVGQKTSVQKLPPKEKNALPEYQITINPGNTTVKELKNPALAIRA